MAVRQTPEGPTPSDTPQSPAEAIVHTLLPHEQFIYEDWTITHAGVSVPAAKIDSIKAAAKKQEVRLRVRGADN